MGLFDRSKQTTNTLTNITSTTNTSTSNLTNQDSGNVITSITDAYKTSITDAFKSSFTLDGLNTTVSQPIAIQAGGASGGGGFDLNSFFSDANTVAKESTGMGKLAGLIPKILFLALIGGAIYWFVKGRKK